MAVKTFGPPVAYWTARFESKHRIAKVINSLTPKTISLAYNGYSALPSYTISSLKEPKTFSESYKCY